MKRSDIWLTKKPTELSQPVSHNCVRRSLSRKIPKSLLNHFFFSCRVIFVSGMDQVETTLSVFLSFRCSMPRHLKSLFNRYLDNYLTCPVPSRFLAFRDIYLPCSAYFVLFSHASDFPSPLSMSCDKPSIFIWVFWGLRLFEIIWKPRE